MAPTLPGTGTALAVVVAIGGFGGINFWAQHSVSQVRDASRHAPAAEDSLLSSSNQVVRDLKDVPADDSVVSQNGDLMEPAEVVRDLKDVPADDSVVSQNGDLMEPAEAANAEDVFIAAVAFDADFAEPAEVSGEATDVIEEVFVAALPIDAEPAEVQAAYAVEEASIAAKPVQVDLAEAAVATSATVKAEHLKAAPASSAAVKADTAIATDGLSASAVLAAAEVVEASADPRLRAWVAAALGEVELPPWAPLALVGLGMLVDVFLAGFLFTCCYRCRRRRAAGASAAAPKPRGEGPPEPEQAAAEAAAAADRSDDSVGHRPPPVTASETERPPEQMDLGNTDEEVLYIGNLADVTPSVPPFQALETLSRAGAAGSGVSNSSSLQREESASTVAAAGNTAGSHIAFAKPIAALQEVILRLSLQEQQQPPLSPSAASPEAAPAMPQALSRQPPPPPQEEAGEKERGPASVPEAAALQPRRASAVGAAAEAPEALGGASAELREKLARQFNRIHSCGEAPAQLGSVSRRHTFDGGTSQASSDSSPATSRLGPSSPPGSTAQARLRKTGFLGTAEASSDSSPATSRLGPSSPPGSAAKALQDLSSATSRLGPSSPPECAAEARLRRAGFLWTAEAKGEAEEKAAKDSAEIKSRKEAERAEATCRAEKEAKARSGVGEQVQTKAKEDRVSSANEKAFKKFEEAQEEAKAEANSDFPPRKEAEEAATRKDQIQEEITKTEAKMLAEIVEQADTVVRTEERTCKDAEKTEANVMEEQQAQEEVEEIAVVEARAEDQAQIEAEEAEAKASAELEEIRKEFEDAEQVRKLEEESQAQAEGAESVREGVEAVEAEAPAEKLAWKQVEEAEVGAAVDAGQEVRREIEKEEAANVNEIAAVNAVEHAPDRAEEVQGRAAGEEEQTYLCIEKTTAADVPEVDELLRHEAEDLKAVPPSEGMAEVGEAQDADAHPSEVGEDEGLSPKSSGRNRKTRRRERGGRRGRASQSSPEVVQPIN